MLQQNAVPPATLELLKNLKTKKDLRDIAALLQQYTLKEMLEIF